MPITNSPFLTSKQAYRKVLTNHSSHRKHYNSTVPARNVSNQQKKVQFSDITHIIPISAPIGPEQIELLYYSKDELKKIQEFGISYACRVEIANSCVFSDIHEEQSLNKVSEKNVTFSEDITTYEVSSRKGKNIRTNCFSYTKSEIDEFTEDTKVMLRRTNRKNAVLLANNFDMMGEPVIENPNLLRTHIFLGIQKKGLSKG